jgi:hypothetical protein
MRGRDRFDGPQQAIRSGFGIARQVGGHVETKRTGNQGLPAQLARWIIEGEKPLDRGPADLTPQDRTAPANMYRLNEQAEYMNDQPMKFTFKTLAPSGPS